MSGTVSHTDKALLGSPVEDTARLYGLGWIHRALNQSKLFCHYYNMCNANKQKQPHDSQQQNIILTSHIVELVFKDRGDTPEVVEHRV